MQVATILSLLRFCRTNVDFYCTSKVLYTFFCCHAPTCLPAILFGGIGVSSLYFSGFCRNDIITLLFYVKYDYNIFQKGVVMEKTISATDAVRKFSEILNSIKYRGDLYFIKS
jgi:hypothetical protein